jgi:NifU-like protein involved in Fe-S cluster formation
LKSAGYSGKAIELYVNKVNVSVIDNPDVALAYTGPCGDIITLYLKMNNNTLIEDAKFQNLGCPASAACGSNLTQIIKGKRLQKTKEITEDNVLMELNGLPDNECRCAELAVTTLYTAISKYEEKEKKF